MRHVRAAIQPTTAFFLGLNYVCFGRDCELPIQLCSLLWNLDRWNSHSSQTNRTSCAANFQLDPTNHFNASISGRSPTLCASCNTSLFSTLDANWLVISGLLKEQLSELSNWMCGLLFGRNYLLYLEELSRMRLDIGHLIAQEWKLLTFR